MTTSATPDHTLPSVAFLGMGLMGSRMTQRLLHAGLKVAVWNRSPAPCEPLVTAGATALELQHIAKYSIICLCLADDHAVNAVYQQLKPALVSGQVIIDFSSLSVAQTQTLANDAKLLGVEWVDAPVSGGVMGAEQGSLVIFAGGESSTIEQLSPVFKPLSQRVTHMGHVGTGQATKICNQLIVAANSTLIAEALNLARQAGVDTALLAPALANGFADSKPLQILAPRMASHQFEPVQWKVQTLAKDLNNAVQLAADLGAQLNVAQSALVQLQQHQQNGYSEHDLSSYILNVESK